MASRYLTPAITFGRTPARMPMDPFRVLQGMDSLLSEVARVAGPLSTAGSDDPLPSPRINVEDKENEIRVTAELPGIRESDVHITLDNDTLTIEGEKRQEEKVNEGDLRIVERTFGQFRRVLQLPFAPDPEKVEARYRDGILTISVPKDASQADRKREIKVERDERSNEQPQSSDAESGAGEASESARKTADAAAG